AGGGGWGTEEAGSWKRAYRPRRAADRGGTSGLGCSQAVEPRLGVAWAPNSLTKPGSASANPLQLASRHPSQRWWSRSPEAASAVRVGSSSSIIALISWSIV